MNRFEAIPSTARRSVFLVLLLFLALVLVPTGCGEDAQDSEPTDQAADQAAESIEGSEPLKTVHSAMRLTCADVTVEDIVWYTVNIENQWTRIFHYCNETTKQSARVCLTDVLIELRRICGGPIPACPNGEHRCCDGVCHPDGGCPSFTIDWYVLNIESQWSRIFENCNEADIQSACNHLNETCDSLKGLGGIHMPCPSGYRRCSDGWCYHESQICPGILPPGLGANIPEEK